MRIPVLSNYDTLEMVDARNLKRLIAEGDILAFRRSSGWVKLGEDPVRGQGGSDYDGPERREIIQRPITEEQRRSNHYCVLGVRGPVQGW